METEIDRSRLDCEPTGTEAEPKLSQRAPKQNRVCTNGGAEAEPNGNQSEPKQNRRETKGDRSRTECEPKGAEAEPNGNQTGPKQNRVRANANHSRTELQPKGTEAKPNENQLRAKSLPRNCVKNGSCFEPCFLQGFGTVLVHVWGKQGRPEASKMFAKSFAKVVKYLTKIKYFF